MKNRSFLLLFLLGIILVAGVGCKKDNSSVTIPELQTHFTSERANYGVLGPDVTFKIPIAVTTVSDVDRTVHFTVSSPSGAIEGVHYTIASTSVVIKAGKATDSLEVKAAFPIYESGERKDTLIFALVAPDVAPASFNDTFTLAVRGPRPPCSENSILEDGALSELLGEYSNSFDYSDGSTTPDWGPYTTVVKSITPTGPNTAEVIIGNVWDYGWKDIKFTMDWSSLTRPKLTFVAQNTGLDAGDLIDPSYAGNNVFITPPDRGTGSFNYCDQTFTINFTLCVPSLGGCLSSEYQTVLSR